MPKPVRGWGFRHLVFAVLVAGSLSACTTPPRDDPDALAEYEAANDPLEVPNRFIFAFNVGLDQLALQPAAVTYRDLFPDRLKPPVKNLITNLFMPLSFLHAMLQGDLDRAEMAASRFFVAMPTLFLGNPFPDEEPVYEDAGQTLGVWGVGAGPYVMLPVLGPSSARDAGGTIIDFFADPVGWAYGSEATIGRGVGFAVEQRSRNIEQVRDMQEKSLDYYAAVRSLYRQKRIDAINNGGTGDQPIPPGPTIGLGDDTGGQQRSDADIR